MSGRWPTRVSKLRADRRIVRSFDPHRINPAFIDLNPQHPADECLLRNPCRGEDQPALAGMLGHGVGQAAKVCAVKVAPGIGFNHCGKITAGERFQPVDHNRSDIESGCPLRGDRHIQHRLEFDPHCLVHRGERAITLGLLRGIRPIERILRRQSMTGEQEWPQPDEFNPTQNDGFPLRIADWPSVKWLSKTQWKIFFTMPVNAVCGTVKLLGRQGAFYA